MIIKFARGNDFNGLFDYLLRHGKHGHLGAARIIATQGVYDERTAAAQMAFNAALAPDRARPVVHLIGRAEIGLSDEKNAQLARRMVQAAGLDGRPFVAIAHDDGHVHVAVCEIDDAGHAPPRVQWSETLSRAVTADEAKKLPRGSVKSRAWDSHLAWRLTKLAREVEVQWGLRQLSSVPEIAGTAEPRLDRWQEERRSRTGEVALQDRYYDQVRSALSLPAWKQRVDALAEYGLKIRIAKSGQRVRGLQVCSMSCARDFAAISAFGLGGMAKLDASADQPFLEFDAGNADKRINLNRPERTFDRVFSRLQVEFRHDLKEWHRSAGRRKAAFNRHKRDKAQISVQIAQLASSMEAYTTRGGLRAATSRLRGDLQAKAKSERDFALIEAGPARKRPVFVEFVKQRADKGDADAARVYQDIAGKVTETRRRRLVQMLSSLSESLSQIAQRATRIKTQIKSLAVPLRAAADALKAHASAIQAQEAQARRRRSAVLAHDLASRADVAGHRIQIDSAKIVHIEQWRATPAEQALIADHENRPIFERTAAQQAKEIQALRMHVITTGILKRSDDGFVIDPSLLPPKEAALFRWADQPEVQEMAQKVADAHRQIDADFAAQAATNAAQERTRSDAACVASSKIVADRRAMQFAHITAAHVFQVELYFAIRETERRREELEDRLARDREQAMRAEIERLATARKQAEAAAQELERNRQRREAELARERDRAHAVRADEKGMVTKNGMTGKADAMTAIRQQRTKLMEATMPGEGDTPATREYLLVWSSSLQALPAGLAITDKDLANIETAAILAGLCTGRSKTVIERIVMNRSPAGHSAKVTFALAMANNKVREALAIQAEKDDRNATKSALFSVVAANSTAEEFVSVWAQILDERPLDTTVQREDRNRSIDFEVARVLSKGGCSIRDVAEALVTCSPSVANLNRLGREAYAEDVLSDFAERLDLPRGWASSIPSIADRADQWSAPGDAVPVVDRDKLRPGPETTLARFQPPATRGPSL